MLDKKDTDLIFSLLAPVAVITFMLFSTIPAATLFMAMLTALALYLHTSEPAVLRVTMTAAFMGLASDLALNATSRRSNAPRSAALQFYFQKVGTWSAAAFAAMLTVWLVLPSFSIWMFLYQKNTDLHWGWLLAIGFCFGFFIGFFSQPTRALKPLLLFYKSTWGWLENRVWDGVSVVFALVPLMIFPDFFRPQNFGVEKQPGP